jgi:thiosulfate/3-mercaptopyruvate sulfurtransferase
MPLRTIVEPAAVAARMSDPSMAIVDCRFDLADTSAGERAYVESHIAGAVYAHLDRDLSGPKTGINGRHPLPAVDALLATLGRLGISNSSQVVAYDQDCGMWASRLWWLLRWLGHDDVAVLDGGWAAWNAEGRPVATGVETRPPSVFTGSPRPGMIVSAADLLDPSSSGVRIVDARAPERFRGEVEGIDPVAGHIPGAVNHFFQWNTEDGKLRSPDDLRARLEQSVGAVDATRIVSYCGSGVTACQNLLALEHAGMTGARLYPGSWSEWISDPSRGIETG